jgi:GT2 family glycosyltransferase
LDCLDALAAGVDDELAIEVIVVDNGSLDGSGEALEQRSDIVLIRNAENRGFAEAVNQAYRRAAGEFVLLLNSDVELRPGSLSTLVRFLRQHPTIAGAAPLYLNPDGTPQPFHFRFPTFSTFLVNGSSVFHRLHPRSEHILREYQMSDADFSRPRPVPQPSASCLLLRTTAIVDDDLLDERYPIFFNDVKLALSLAARGEELWVVPQAIVSHEAHSSAKMLAPRTGRRQYLGSIVRLLSETEPPAKVWLYRAVVFLQNTVLWALGKPGALHGAELRKALAGDPGPLPRQPTP